MTPAVPIPTAPPTGLLLLAHGARDAAWARPFEAVAAQCRHAMGRADHVALAFLEFMAPDLPAAGRALADAGCHAVVVVPLFLGAGGHVRKDVPALVAQLQADRPGLAVRLAPAVGEAPALIAAMAEVALTAAACPPTDERAIHPQPAER